MTSLSKGFINGVVSGVSFGLIPLFSLPVIQAGMSDVSVLVYRFMFGSAGMLAALLYLQTPLRITWGELWRICILAFFYLLSSITLFESYHYLSSGVATAFVYTDPIWCTVIGLLFFGKKFSWKLTSAILLATLGVSMLAGVFGDEVSFPLWGIFLALMAGLTYALYLVFLPRMRIKEIPSLKLTFYVFFIEMVYLIVYCMLFKGGLDRVTDFGCWINLIMLGLIPTALSNICVTVSLRLIDSTIVALLGAFEPLTAMVIGVCFFGESCGIFCIIGTVLILSSVRILAWGGRK